MAVPVTAQRIVAGLALLFVSSLVPGADESKPPTPPMVDLSKGGPTFRSGDNSLTIGAYIQTRFVVDDREAWDEDTSGSGVGEEDGVVPSFDIARLRLILRGGMFRPWLKYFFAYEVTRTSGDSDSKLRDGFIDVEKNPWASVRVGQYKVPFSLQEIIIDPLGQFTERAITTTKFAPARDMGVTLSGAARSKKWGYAGGVFNGSGESHVQEDNRLLYTGRLWYEPLQPYLYSEGAIEMPEKAQLHFGAGYRTGEAIRGGDAGVFEDVNNQTAFNLETGWRYRRWFATAEWFAQTTDRENPVSLDDVDADGFHVQGGFMAWRDRLELALRRAQVDPDSDTGRDQSIESRAGVNWYFQKHGLKLQADFGSVVYQANSPSRGTKRLPSAAGESVTDNQVRIQFQLFF